MSLRRVDARFVLPEAPATAVVLGSLEGWEDGLRRAGVDVGGSVPPDLLVTTAAEMRGSPISGPRMVLVEGRGTRRALAQTFPVVERFLSVPSVTEPSLILPLRHRAAGDYAIRHWSVALDRRRRLRNTLARSLLNLGLLPELRPLVTLGTDGDPTPWLIRSAEGLGVSAGCEWFLTLGSSDALARGVFHAFPPGATEPAWALKFARVSGYADSFDRDERGLSIARAAGEVVRDRAPMLVGRFEVGGLNASVETAAVGTRLTHILQGRASRAEKLRVIDAVAGWTVDAARATATSPDRLLEERTRLAEVVIPAWRELGVASDLVRQVGPVPAVVQHNDLGSWNIVVENAARFTAVDWESARPEGFPLWDLVYFLTDALLHLDGASASDRRNAHTLSLYRGELASSAVLFGWLRRSVEAIGISENQVGPIVTLCWLHHGCSGHHRRSALQEYASERAAIDETPDAERIAQLWLTSPGLGVSWDAWRRA